MYVRVGGQSFLACEAYQLQMVANNSIIKNNQTVTVLF